MSLTEEWRDIASFEGMYQVSNLGRVRALPRPQRSYGGRAWTNPGRTLKTTVIKDKGYHVVSLCKGKYKKRPYIHTLVLEAFVGPRPTSKHQGCHNDGNGSNNVLTNLRWDTPKANAADRVRHGTDPVGIRHPRAKYTEDQIREAKIMMRDDPKLSLRKIAKITGIADYTLYQIKRNNQWTNVEI